MCQKPALCAETTLQPLRRYKNTLDAVVIFSDILIVPQAMGLEVLMQPGPFFPQPILTPACFSRLNFKPDADKVFKYLYDGITMTRRKAAEEIGKAVPVLGFCGAPWTLMAYCIGAGEGEGSAPAPPRPEPVAGIPPPVAPKTKTGEGARLWIYKYPEAAHELLQHLTNICIDLLVGQWRAGASMLQVFESSGGDLPPALFNEFALPYLKQIAQGVRARTPKVEEGGPPIICFARNAHHKQALEGLVGSGYDALSIDWSWDMEEVRLRLNEEAARRNVPAPAVQGNLDPAALLADPEVIVEQVRRMCIAVGPDHPHIANLGHGMLPQHKPEHLSLFFEAIGEISRDVKKGGDGKAAAAAVLSAYKGQRGPLMFTPTPDEMHQFVNAAVAESGISRAE